MKPGSLLRSMTKAFSQLPTALSTEPPSCLSWKNPGGLTPAAFALTVSPACGTSSDSHSPPGLTNPLLSCNAQLWQQHLLQEGLFAALPISGWARLLCWPLLARLLHPPLIACCKHLLMCLLPPDFEPWPSPGHSLYWAPYVVGTEITGKCLETKS